MNKTWVRVWLCFNSRWDFICIRRGVFENHGVRLYLNPSFIIHCWCWVKNNRKHNLLIVTNSENLITLMSNLITAYMSAMHNSSAPPSLEKNNHENILQILEELTSSEENHWNLTPARKNNLHPHSCKEKLQVLLGLQRNNWLFTSYQPHLTQKTHLITEIHTLAPTKKRRQERTGVP